MGPTDQFSDTDANLPVLIPVVLADNCNLNLWPTSRISMPVQLQQKPTGLSPFEEVLSNLDKIENLLPPIICLSSSCLRPALEQLNPYQLRDSATLLISPLDRGSLHCATASALLAHESYINAVMVIIDCAHPPTNWSAFSKLLSQVQRTPGNESSIIMCGHPVDSAQATQLSVKRINATFAPGFFTCKQATPVIPGTVFELGSVLFSSPEIFLRQINKLSPNALANCSKALQNAEQNPGGIWPNFNIWSFLEHQDLLTTLIQDCTQLLLRPIELHDQSEIKQTGSDLIFTEGTKNCSIEAEGHLIAVVGCENLRVVSTKDATLIVSKDKLECLSPILSRLRSQERPEIYDPLVRYRTWGKETEFERYQDYSVMRVEVNPNEAIPENTYKHRTKILQVLSGKGQATVGDGSYPLAPGISLTVPAKAPHEIQNLGKSKLVLLATLHTLAERTYRHSAGISASSPP